MVLLSFGSRARDRAVKSVSAPGKTTRDEGPPFRAQKNRVRRGIFVQSGMCEICHILNSIGDFAVNLCNGRAKKNKSRM